MLLKVVPGSQFIICVPLPVLVEEQTGWLREGTPVCGVSSVSLRGIALEWGHAVSYVEITVLVSYEFILYHAFL